MRPLPIATVTAALLLPSPALAQALDWSGPYVGGRVGYGYQPEDTGERVEFDTNLDGSFGDTVRTAGGANAFAPGFCGGTADSATATECNQDKNGIEFGVHAGYDHQVAGTSMLIGVVAEIERSKVRDGVTAFSSTPAFYSFERRLRGSAGVRARAGVIFGNTLGYGTAGFAYGKVRRSFTTSNRVNTFTLSDDDDRSVGYRVGGGVEHRLTGNISIGAQYLFTGFKDKDFTVRTGGANVPVSNPFILVNPNGTDLRRTSSRFNINNLSVVANFRF